MKMEHKQEKSLIVKETSMFIFSKNTKIISEDKRKPILNAVKMLERDRDKVFFDSSYPENSIVLDVGNLEEEQYEIKLEGNVLKVIASDELGFIYGLLYISEKYLNIKPFWFWMDQKIGKIEKEEIKETYFKSQKAKVRFRGWFFNDEVLMLKWKYNQNKKAGWEMAFESLLRNGGNMAIPGTDKMSRENKSLANDMGLWITHHHAEPLGAEMFIRAFPELEANFMEYSDLFYQLWEEAVIEQKNCKVVWNLCFRGQGDSPFWNSDSSGQFDTAEKRGKLISDLIKKQCDIVKKHIKNPIFCTNLYGEIMELYEQGHIELEEGIIKVRADNGFGKMVTRRRDGHSVRASSMPDKKDLSPQGIYYHVSFYDLQAANHITMLPNSVSFVDHELSEVLANGGKDFWVINCSNVRPHTYYLDAVKKKWFGRNMNDEIQSKEFVSEYFNGEEEIAKCYKKYPEAMISYGEHEDEHMGEQYYTENIRIIVNQFLVDPSSGAKALKWIAGDRSLSEQVRMVCNLCRVGLDKLEKYYYHCESISDKIKGDKKLLFDTTLLLQTKIHYFCAKGVVLFGDAYAAYEEEDYKKAFILFGNATECFDYADEQMRDAEYGVWEDFYLNDCFADVKHTAYMIRKIMGVMRELGDNPRHDKWYREYCYAKEDQKVFLLLVLDNHMTDWELYKVMKE